MTRREFGLLACAVLLRVRTRGLNVRIGFMGDAFSKAGRGARLSALEAARAATLLGNDINLVAMRGADDFSNVSGIVVVGATAFDVVPSDIPVVIAIAGDGRHAVNAFRVQPTPSAKCTVWNGELEKYGAAQLNDRYRSEFHEDMDADAWAGWFAVKVLWESALRARSDKGGDILRFLKSARATFDGHKGDLLRFDATGQLIKWQESDSASSYPCS